MKLTFLGTGAGLPSKDRNVSSCVLDLQEERKALWIFDCGEGTQHQLLKTKLKLNKIEKIFITHLHGDHLFGLPGLLGSRSMRGGALPLTVYGPKGIKAYLEAVLQISDTYLPYPLEIIEITQGIIFEDEQCKVTALPLKHRIESYGYRIVEKDKLGALDNIRLKQLGIPIGRHYQQIKQGETVVLNDGCTINGKDFLGPTRSGKIIAIFGDTEEPIENAILLAKNADVVVHEATVEASLMEAAKKYQHSTTIQTAQMAQDAQAKKLIITHISSRYQLGDHQRLLNECRAIFPETEIAQDLMSFDV